MSFAASIKEMEDYQKNRLVRLSTPNQKAGAQISIMIAKKLCPQIEGIN